MLATGLLALCGVTLFIIHFLTMNMPGASPRAPVFEFSEGFKINKKTPDGIEYSVNNSTATFDLDVDDPDEHCDRVFKSYAAAIDYCASLDLPLLPSVQLVQGKCKQLDDSLCATLEAAVQTGIDGAKLAGKRDTLRKLLVKLQELRAKPELPAAAAPAFDEASAYVATALLLGGSTPEIPAKLASRVDDMKRSFISDPIQSRPIGFWDANDELRAIYMQDRFLMRGCNLESAIAIAVALHNDPSLLKSIEGLQEFGSKLTNRVVFIDTGSISAPQAKLVGWRDLMTRVLPEGADTLDSLSAAKASAVRETRQSLVAQYGKDFGFALVSYSASREYALLQSLTIGGILPEANRTMSLIIDAIKSGQLTLEPDEHSGWYDYQLYALETLLLHERGRESGKLNLSDAYKERLENAFRTILAKQRETHIKHIPTLTVGDDGDGPQTPIIEIGPELSVEPTATVYLRMARGYRFLLDALRAVLGEDALRNLHRRYPTSTSPSESIDKDLKDASQLLYGLYETACFEIGLRPEYLEGELTVERTEVARTSARAWLGSLHSDVGLAADTRFAVPITRWVGWGRDSVHYWASCGVRLERVAFEYDKKPRIAGGIEPDFVPSYYYAPTDVFVECERPGNTPFTRDEFREICDASQGETALRKALGAAPCPVPKGISFVTITLLILLAGGSGVLLHKYGGRLRGLQLRRRLAPYYTRRNVLIGLGVLSSLALCWAMAMILSPGYRIRFLVKHVAPLNTNLAILCKNRFIYRIHPRYRAPALIGLLGDNDPQARYIASICLMDASYGGVSLDAYFQSDETKLALQAAAMDPVLEVAVNVTMILGAIEAPDNVEFLLRRLKSTSRIDGLCGAALWSLGNIGDPRVVESVGAFVEDPREHVQWLAIRALARFDDPRATELIRRLLLSPDEKVMVAASEAIESVACFDPGTDIYMAPARLNDAILLGASRLDAPARTRLYLAQVVGDPALRARAYLAIIRSPSEGEGMSMASCRQQAARDLKYNLDRRDEAEKLVLEEAASDEHPDVRAAAQTALTRIIRNR